MAGSGHPEYQDSGMAMRSSSTSRSAVAVVCGEPVDWLNMTTPSGPSPDITS